MKLHNNFLTLLSLAFFAGFITACDKTTQETDSSTIDRQSLSYAYFVNDVANHTAPSHQNISALLVLNCGASICHGLGGNNGGTFKLFGNPLTDAKNISNFASAQAHVVKGLEDTSPTVTTNNYPLAHSSPLLSKPLSELAGGTKHKGGNNIFTIATESVVTVNGPGNDYGEIYRWIAFTP